MNKFNPFDSQHYVRKVEKDVSQVCAPLFQKLGLNYFHYARFYKDGSLSVLYSRIEE